MTEAELQQLVTEKATALGLLWHHCSSARWCDGTAGLPDLIIVGEGGVIFAELKSEDGDLSAPQDLWAWMLHMAGQGTALWRPVDWECGAITQQLEALK